jgi:spore germination protein YaaH
MSGADVTALQTALIAKGYLAAGKNTGYFGALTDAALKKFQCDKNIICTGASVSGYGVYGPKTQAALAAPNVNDVLATQTNAPSTPRATGKFEFSGWLPYWRVATGTQDVLPHLSQLTTVMPFSYTVDGDGILIDDAHLAQEPWPTFIAQAKQSGVRIIPSILWGNGDDIHNILSNTQTRVALEDAIADLVKRNNFDGIDIDFEAKKHETIDYFSTFLKGLYQRMGNKWVYCTVEARMPLTDRYLPGQTIPSDAADFANDYTEMNKYCDRIEIMAYDQGTVSARLNAARTAPYAPVADPGWVENLVTLASQTISKNKLILGIPTYGYEYTVTPLAGGGYQYNRLWPFNPRYATDIAAKLGITPARTSANEIGFTYDAAKLQAAPTGADATQVQQTTEASTTFAQNAGSQVNTNQPFNYVTWSDATAIKDKVDLAKRLGIRGVAVFKFDGGQDPGMWDVLK